MYILTHNNIEWQCGRMNDVGHTMCQQNNTSIHRGYGGSGNTFLNNPVEID